MKYIYIYIAFAFRRALSIKTPHAYTYSLVTTNINVRDAYIGQLNHIDEFNYDSEIVPISNPMRKKQQYMTLKALASGIHAYGSWNREAVTDMWSW